MDLNKLREYINTSKNGYKKLKSFFKKIRESSCTHNLTWEAFNLNIPFHEKELHDRGIVDKKVFLRKDHLGIDIELRVGDDVDTSKTVSTKLW